MKTKAINMTEGNAYKLLIAFSLPLLFGNVLQQLYNTVDSIIVGRYISEQALAGVGTGFPIIFMTSAMFMGLGTGATIMISQYFGANDIKNIQKTINTINCSFLSLSIPISAVGILISKPILILMNVPDDGTLDIANSYLTVIFIGFIFSIGYNINAGILQGLGDSKTTLIFLAISTVINIALDLLFVLVFSMGVIGVGLATIIAQATSWLFGVWYINKKYDIISVKIFQFDFDKAIFLQAVRLGVPAGIQQALFCLGIVFMQGLVNSYGTEFMAGFNGANKIDSFAFMPIQSFAVSATTFVGQNVGAGNIDRVRKGSMAALSLAVGTSLLIGGVTFPFAESLMKLFNDNPVVIESGARYLHTVLPFYALLSCSFVFAGVLRGIGNNIVPLIVSIVSLWLVRIPTAYLLDHLFGKDYIFYSYAVGWLVGSIIVMSYYLSNKWVSIAQSNIKVNKTQQD